jgi:two-component system KDP operon response regulator KdpE
MCYFFLVNFKKATSGKPVFLLFASWETLMNETKILLVGDEPNILRPIRRNLMHRGYEVSLALDPEDVEFFLSKEDVDLFVIKLDFQTLDIDGLQIVQMIRRKNKVPIIVLSTIGSENRKIQALDMGADDYLVIPFGMGEFLARVRASLRRWASIHDNLGAKNNRRIIVSEDLFIDLNTHKVKIKGEEVHLTPTEFDLLSYMAQNQGRIIPHSELLKEVWGLEYCDERAYLRVFVSQLRQKIEIDPSRPKFILTEPRIGYRFFRA